MVIGIVFSVFGFLIFLSLVLTNVDKALHSGGVFTGYALTNSTLPNPADTVLVLAQTVFPLDYILYTLMVLFLLSCSMSGITNIGIRCLCLSVYKVRAWRTPPRGLLLTVLLLMFIILAQNVIMLSLVPDYTMFGNQHYVKHGDNGTTAVRCSAQNFPDQKVTVYNHNSSSIGFHLSGRLCSFTDISSVAVISLQSMDIRCSLLLVDMGPPRFCSLWISLFHLLHEVYSGKSCI